MDISDEDALAWALAESLRMADVKQAEEAQLEEALRVSAAEEAQLEEVLRVSAAGVPVADKTPSTPEVIRVNSCASSRRKRQMNRRQRLQHIGVESESASPSPGKSESLSTTATSNKSVLSRSTSNVASFASSKRPPIAGRQPTSEHPSWHLPEMPPISSTQLALSDRARGNKAAVAPVLCWLRQEMRLEDNRALAAAAATGRPVIPLYVHPAEGEEGGFPLVGAAMYWQHHSLNNLQHALASLGSGLVIRDGRSGDGGTLRQLLEVLAESGALDVFYSSCYEPWRQTRDAEICRVLADSGVRTHCQRGSLLFAPWDARPDEKSGGPLGFGSVGWFLNGCRDCPEPEPPVPAPTRLRAPRAWPSSLSLSALGLARMPQRMDGSVVDWARGIRSFWAAGEAGAQAALTGFLADAVSRFEGRQRHRADERNTALISPYLRFGELSPCTVLHRVQEQLGKRAPPTFLRRLAWRDLAYWSLWRFPWLPERSFRPHYDQQWWEESAKPFEAWCAARTGYPLVDAAMTQLWQTGWIPNYMRHVVASFLVEFLNVDWRKGQQWFAQTLVDADTAINAYMWQNGGHSGMDQWNFVMHPGESHCIVECLASASPVFMFAVPPPFALNFFSVRGFAFVVFAAKTCDPEGEYVRRWLPQLAKLPVEFIHCPWEAPFTMRASAKVVIGSGAGCTYAARIITDLEAARRKSHGAVMTVRKSPCGAAHVLPSGHEWLEVGGKRVVLITRVDFREGKITTRQTAEVQWDKSRRERGDTLSLAMRDSEREAEAHL